MTVLCQNVARTSYFPAQIVILNQRFVQKFKIYNKIYKKNQKTTFSFVILQ